MFYIIEYLVVVFFVIRSVLYIGKILVAAKKIIQKILTFMKKVQNRASIQNRAVVIAVFI